MRAEKSPHPSRRCAERTSCDEKLAKSLALTCVALLGLVAAGCGRIGYAVARNIDADAATTMEQADAGAADLDAAGAGSDGSRAGTDSGTVATARDASGPIDGATGTIDGATCEASGAWLLCTHPGYSWSEAVANCRARGARLAEVRSVIENEELAAWARTLGTSVWLGGSDEAVDGTWRWTDGSVFWTADGSVRGYTNWADGEPLNDTRENCLQMFEVDGTWNDQECGAVFGAFACRAR